MNAFRARAGARRVPLSAVLELTRRCNLRCVHCYLGEKAARAADPERDTAAVCRSLDEWAEAGCLELLITGGDPMMRDDFAAVYRHAAESGMLVTVFCDGVLVTDAIVALFRELPPRWVEVSIYGATADTYERVTRVPGSHARAWKGIRRLVEAGVRLKLKTMLLTLNQHELGEMAEQARAMGCQFRFDAAVFPCLTDPGGEAQPATDAAPLHLRVSPEVAVAWDLAFPERRRKWAAAIEKHRSGHLAGSGVYACGAGVNGFFADAYGNLSPCLMATHFRYRQQGRPFLDIWNREMIEIRAMRRTLPDGDLYGPMRGACSHCPALNRLETGDEETESDYMKETTRLRYEALAQERGKDGTHERNTDNSPCPGR